MKPTHSFFIAFILVISVLSDRQGVSANAGDRLGMSPITADRAAPSVLAMEQIPRTPERLARGKYLVEGLLQCTLCHSDNDFGKRPLEPLPGMKNGGHVFDRAQMFGPGSQIVASNITSDPEYGAGKWRDADFVRALRQGIGHDGRTLYPMMPYKYFRDLSDEDLASTIVYERSLPPVHMQRPRTTLPESVTKDLQPLPPPERVPEPDRSNQVEYGKYLVSTAHCKACHTPRDENNNLISDLEFAGGQIFTGPYGLSGATVQVASLNLTPDPSGIPYFDEQKFIEVIRTGRVTARPLASIMPWSYFRNLNDDDLKAIFAYLRILKPVKHRVDNTEPPTYCRLCRHKHGLGNMN